MKAIFIGFLQKFKELGLLGSSALALVSIQPILVLFWSSTFGRLAYSLGYDDINYALDVLNRINVIRESGLTGFAAGLISSPPHSPLSTFFGLIGMPFFGLSDLGFYAGNAVAFWIVAFLGFRLISSLDFSPESFKWIWLVLLSISPLGITLVTDSRPDVLYCFVFFFMSVHFWRFLRQDTSVKPIIIGLFFWASLAAKPTAFAHTFGILGLTFIVSLILRYTSNHVFAWQSFIRAFFWSVLFCGPLIIAQWGPISSYFIETSTPSQLEIWRFSGEDSFLGLFLKYMTPFWQRLGGLLSVLSIVAVLVHVIVRRLRLPIDIYYALGMGFISFTLVVSQGVKNEFFFAFAHIVLLFVLGYLVSFAFDAKKKSLRETRSLAVVSVSLICASIPLSLSLIVTPGYPENKKTDGEVKSLLNVIERNGISAIYLPTAGALNGENLRWEYGKSGLELDTGPLSIKGAALLSNVPESLAIAEEFDYVLAPNLVTANYFEWLPSTPILDDIIENFAVQGFRPLEYSGSKDSRYYLLKRDSSESQLPFLLSVSGLGVKERFSFAYREFETRKISSSGFDSCWYVPRDGTYSLEIETLEQSTMTVSHSGTPKQDLTSGQSTRHILNFNFQIGKNCMHFSVSPVVGEVANLKAAGGDFNLKLVP